MGNVKAGVCDATGLGRFRQYRTRSYGMVDFKSIGAESSSAKLQPDPISTSAVGSASGTPASSEEMRRRIESLFASSSQYKTDAMKTVVSELTSRASPAG